MALSQCLDDSPARWPTKQGNDYNLQEFYNERHRLALEELVSGGVDNFREFLLKESIPNFLSDDEIRCIGRTAVDPRCTSNQGEEMTFEQSVRNSMDCSSVTYFPEISDIEPPVLEIGWPAFTSGSFRGVTRAVAHFQPSYGECIYSCKEAARRMIKSAKEVIAIVTDSLTDLDIFKDLQEACITRKVPVYILLDQSCAPAFFKMCSNLKVQLEELQQMRVRTITGGTYFMRSGAKITGKVHERFMLIDGNRVATGSYRFNWTDGKLNSSNLIELSGQITENFDEEFRILYAQSMPFNSQVPPSVRNSGIYDHLLIRPQVTSSPLPAKVRPKESICQTSTPSRASVQALGTHRELTEERGGQSSAVSNSSTVGENWMEQQHMQEVLTGSVGQCFSPDKTPPNTVIDQLASPIKPPCHVFTQTSSAKVNTAVQTDLEPSPLHADLPLCPDNTTPAHSITSIQKGSVSSSNASSASRNYLSTPGRMVYPPGLRHCTVPPDDNLRDCFRKLTKERQYHYSTIRSKLEHMVTMLSHRRELVELTNMALGTGVLRAQKAQKEFGQRLDPGLLMDGMGTWPRARCLH